MNKSDLHDAIREQFGRQYSRGDVIENIDERTWRCLTAVEVEDDATGVSFGTFWVTYTTDEEDDWDIEDYGTDGYGEPRS